MSWSFRLGTVLGIPIRIHVTFLLLLVLLSAGEASRAGMVAGARILLLMVLLFACVLLHELGHCVVALRFGVGITSITLYPFGGIAVLDEIPRQPSREILIAIAGPIVNFLIAAGLFVVWASLSLSRSGDWGSPGGATLLGMLFRANLGLGLFNLIPAYPMDGGRILRGLLAARMSYVRATQWAARFGKAFGGLFVLIGILKPDLWLPVIGVFLYIVASSEEQAALLQAAIEGHTVGDLMITDYQALAPADALHDVVRRSLHTFQEEFPVVQEGAFLGVVTRARMLEALRESGQESTVQSAILPVRGRVSPAESLREALRRMRAERVSLLPVMDDSGLRGIVTLSGILRGSALLAGSPPESQDSQR